MQGIIRFLNNLIAVTLILCISLNVSYAEKNNVPVYNSNVKQGKKIALTFDDGPHPKNTGKILEILDEFDIKATFFVIGVNIKNYPEAMKKIVERGHEIGNHTYSHRILKNRAAEEIFSEINETEREISKYTSSHVRLMRPPCGLYDDALVRFALENQYKIVLWNIDTKDWEHVTSSSIENNVLNRIKGGDIILFHDYISGENNTPKALLTLIPKLIKEGYTFVTVSELLQNA